MNLSRLLFILIFVLPLSTANSFGQQAPAHPTANNNMVRDNSLVAGNFEIEKNNTQRGIVEHINVNYMISPAPFKNVMNLELSTPNPLLFSADIVDSKGNKMIHWEPSEKSYHYKEGVDISKLAAGDYKLNIYCEYGAALLHSISFQKS